MKTVLRQSLRGARIILCVVSSMALAQGAQAASFDCAKAQTNVEKLICADVDLSRLDENLAAAYASALKGGGNAADVHNAQNRWIKERNICADVACLKASYGWQIVWLKTQAEPSTDSASRVSSQRGTPASSVHVLAPFTFGPAINNSMANQREEPVCQDFLNHMNHPRSNELLNPDGTLVHESEKIKSVHWERLDKEKYREGFMTVVDAEKAINIRGEHLKRYADSGWVLERTPAHPQESRPKSDAPEKWLYRLMPSKPYPRNWSDPNSKAELPTWFPYTSINWLGDQRGKRHVADVHRMYGGHLQWLEYEGKTHAIDNATSGGGKGATPKYLEIHVYALHVDTESNSILYLTCALRARNPE